MWWRGRDTDRGSAVERDASDGFSTGLLQLASSKIDGFGEYNLLINNVRDSFLVIKCKKILCFIRYSVLLL